MRQYISLFKPLSVWYFVIAGQASKHSLHTPSHKNKRLSITLDSLPFFTLTSNCSTSSSNSESFLDLFFLHYQLHCHGFCAGPSSIVCVLIIDSYQISPVSSLTPTQSAFHVARRSWKWLLIIHAMKKSKSLLSKASHDSFSCPYFSNIELLSLPRIYHPLLFPPQILFPFLKHASLPFCFLAQ